MASQNSCREVGTNCFLTYFNFGGHMATDPLSVIVNDGCSSGPCPKVYKSKEGKYYVRGYIVSKQILEGLALPDDESLVEINIELLRNVVKVTR